MPKALNWLAGTPYDRSRWKERILGRSTVKISARNTLKGRIVEISKGATTSHVRIDIGGATVTASITNEAVDDLKLAVGRQAYAVVKASDVMVGVD
jgi:molybdopterin-binding protein